MSSATKSKRNTFSTERFVWELQRAFYSFRNGPVLAILLFQIAAFVVVHAKGAGTIYRDMIGILFLITLISWFFTSVIQGNKRILICALLLLTVGTMLQCIMEQEQIVKKPELLSAGNPAAGLQLQYLLGFAAGLLAAGCYLRWKQIAGMRMCRIGAVRLYSGRLPGSGKCAQLDPYRRSVHSDYGTGKDSLCVYRGGSSGDYPKAVPAENPCFLRDYGAGDPHAGCPE